MKSAGRTARPAGQSVGRPVERIRDLMRRDAGVDGDAQRLGQLAWLLFLKVWDERGGGALPASLRWRSWASPAGDGAAALTGDALLAFVDERLFPALRNLPGDGLAAVARAVFADVSNVMRSGTLLRQVLTELDAVTLAPGAH